MHPHVVLAGQDDAAKHAAEAAAEAAEEEAWEHAEPYQESDRLEIARPNKHLEFKFGIAVVNEAQAVDAPAEVDHEKH